LKTTFLAVVAISLEIAAPGAVVITEWNFNSSISDTNPITGTLVASAGMGVTATLGGVTGSFASGVNSDHGGGPDNSGWSTSHYPTGPISNKSAGVQFMVDTSDFEQLQLSWFQRNSATASRYARLQYTTNGKDFQDAAVMTVSTDGVYTNLSCDMSQTPGVSNNPLFGFRIVSEFEVTATGAGQGNYVATRVGSLYGVNGTIRFDLVRVLGSLISGANTPPGLSEVSNLVVKAQQVTGPLPVHIWDLEDSADSLELTSVSSDPLVIPEQNIIVSGTGSERMLTVIAGERLGSAHITLCVADTGGKKTCTNFTVTVLPADTPPFISSIPRVDMVRDAAPPTVAFNVSDLETPAESLSVTAQSDNPILVPNGPGNLVFGGSGRDRTLTIIPATAETGVAPITVSVMDGTNTTKTVFPVLVAPSENVVLYDRFDYRSGSLLTNSGFLWRNRSGSPGECQVTNQELMISSSKTEDVVALLAGGPYSRGNHTMLYASFRIRLLSMPRASPAYFAHFVGGTSLRGRIYLAASAALPGCFRVFVSNGNGSPVEMPWNLNTNAAYKVVCRYDIDSAATTIWANPRAETDISVTAADPQSAISIAGYGFRQDTDVGTDLLIDDLRVGSTFESVDSEDNARLLIERGVAQVVLRWENAGMTLQRGLSPAGPFSDLPGASSPFVAPITNPAAFFRLRAH
jgi:hypothetical protein